MPEEREGLCICIMTLVLTLIICFSLKTDETHPCAQECLLRGFYEETYRPYSDLILRITLNNFIFAIISMVFTFFAELLWREWYSWSSSTIRCWHCFGSKI